MFSPNVSSSSCELQEILSFYQGKMKCKLIFYCLQANNDFCSTIVIFFKGIHSCFLFFRCILFGAIVFALIGLIRLSYRVFTRIQTKPLCSLKSIQTKPLCSLIKSIQTKNCVCWLWIRRRHNCCVCWLWTNRNLQLYKILNEALCLWIILKGKTTLWWL